MVRMKLPARRDRGRSEEAERRQHRVDRENPAVGANECCQRGAGREHLSDCGGDELKGELGNERDGEDRQRALPGSGSPASAKTAAAPTACHALRMTATSRPGESAREAARESRPGGSPRRRRAGTGPAAAGRASARARPAWALTSRCRPRTQHATRARTSRSARRAADRRQRSRRSGGSECRDRGPEGASSPTYKPLAAAQSFGPARPRLLEQSLGRRVEGDPGGLAHVGVRSSSTVPYRHASARREGSSTRLTTSSAGRHRSSSFQPPPFS